MDKYAIYVAERLAEIRDFRISEILDEEYDLKINSKSNFIGFTEKIKFINWYDNLDYVKIWNTKEEAQSFLDYLMERANTYYNTYKDPFYHVRKTKGDWKNFHFIVIKLN